MFSTNLHTLLSGSRIVVILQHLVEPVDGRSVRLIGYATPDEVDEHRYRLGYGDDILDVDAFDASRYPDDYRTSFVNKSADIVATLDMAWLSRPCLR